MLLLLFGLLPINTSKKSANSSGLSRCVQGLTILHLVIDLAIGILLGQKTLP